MGRAGGLPVHRRLLACVEAVKSHPVLRYSADIYKFLWDLQIINENRIPLKATGVCV